MEYEADVVSAHLVKIRGTIFAEIFLIPKSSVIICHTVSLVLFNSYAIRLSMGLASRSLHETYFPLQSLYNT
jgi:hypothetical protein